MLKAIVSWWAGQMKDLLPASLRPRAAGPGDALLFSLEAPPSEQRTPAASERDAADQAGPVVSVIERRGRRESVRFAIPLAGLDPGRLIGARKRRTVALRLPATAVLEREVSLPLATERDLRSVLAYEMDRFTPFAADAVFWDYAIAARERERGLLRLRLSVVPRAMVQPLISVLDRAGIRPARIEAAFPGGIMRCIPVGEPSASRTRLRRRALAIGGWACAGLAVAALAAPLVSQSLTVSRTEAEIAALAPRVHESEALRRRLAGAAGGTDAISAERLRLGDPLRMLAAVTRLLPDDTYLTHFAVQRRSLTLEGQSQAAARLLGLLSADPTIRGAGFSAPVTRGAGGADVFALTATATR